MPRNTEPRIYVHTFPFKLGDEVRDVITGWKGVITGLCAYMTGCDQACVTNRPKDNVAAQGFWYDVNRLELIKPEAVKLPSQINTSLLATSAYKKGGPADFPAPVK